MFKKKIISYLIKELHGIMVVNFGYKGSEQDLLIKVIKKGIKNDKV